MRDTVAFNDPRKDMNIFDLLFVWKSKIYIPLWIDMSLQRTPRGNPCEGLHILTVQLGDLSIRLDTGWSD
jgi:hypothetical protein